MMELPISLIPAVAGTFFAAGIVKGITGMGLPTMAMGILGALISPLAAASLLIVPSFITNVWQLSAGPALRPLLRRLWPMMATIILGTLLGSSWLAEARAGTASAALGAALIAYSAYTLLARQLHVPRRAEPWLSPLIGLLTGLVAGATGVFVLPAVPYLQALALEKDDLVQALGLSFTVSTLALALGLGLRGAFPLEHLAPSALAVLPALAGMWAGQALRRVLSPRAFRRGFLACLLALGADLLLRPLL
ncbi:sulfite exporter TauE/SafE family protein [Xanthobacter sp. V0B-10]|uniref:sulfite exporter TauE/SafE family protein n=1 Tax=Xanthobacter albus TaxID=3119929 RepID=UPI00372B2422